MGISFWFLVFGFWFADVVRWARSVLLLVRLSDFSFNGLKLHSWLTSRKIVSKSRGVGSRYIFLQIVDESLRWLQEGKKILELTKSELYSVLRSCRKNVSKSRSAGSRYIFLSLVNESLSWLQEGKKTLELKKSGLVDSKGAFA